MLYSLDRQHWVKEIEVIRSLLLNEQEKIINSICDVYKCNVVYFLFKRKDKVIISFIAFVKGNRIFQPVHFFYSAFWVDDHLSDRVYIDSVFEFVGKIKGIYNVIDIVLPVQIKDIRPFLWQDFSVGNRFTYLKRTAETKYGKYMERKLAKASTLPFQFLEEKLNYNSIALNLDLLTQLKFRASKVKKIENLLQLLSTTKYLVAFNSYLDNRLVISDILLKDEENKKIYEILKNKSKEVENIHSISYHHLFKFYNQQGYVIVDLMGADMQSISKFKAGFNPSLVPHFVVNYKRIYQLKSVAKKYIKDVLKSVVRKI